MFYDNYAGLCKEKGVSPSKAAEEIGINKASVTNWKKNGYTPRADILQRIAGYFDVSVSVLLEGDSLPEQNGEPAMKMLRAVRKSKGLTMKELGERVGVSESAISQYETGKREADLGTLLKIGEVLDCSIDYLLRGEENKKSPPPIGDGLDEQDRQLMELMKRLSADQKEFLLAQLLTLTGQSK